ncbi:MAG: translation initiation factor IF-2 N-terminal domain-containing protein, partial [Eubacteriales bacterium]|nr:translation initiation factor IF-2 N-terminal domain-containing protein [Eubacteriales bacterium]
MSKVRVHELAGELGRQNREVMEFLKAKGVDVKSHMSSIDEPYIAMVRDKFTHMGKENARMDTPKTEEKMTTAKPEAEKAEAPKKKKNIIRVYHAQNASDGGKGRQRRPGGERKGGQRPQGGAPQGQKPQAPKAGDQAQPKAAAPAAQKPKNPEVKAAETTAAAQTSAKGQQSEQTAAARPQERPNRENNRDSRENNRDS